MTSPASPLKDYNLKAALQNGLTFGDNMLAAWVDIPGCVHGTERQWKNALPRGCKPIAFWPRKTVDGSGNVLQLVGDPLFNDQPLGGNGKVRDGYFGITPQFAPPLGAIALRKSVNQNANSGANTKATWDVEDLKIGNLTHDNSTNNSRITCAAAGLVRVSYHITWSNLAPALGNTVGVFCGKNNTVGVAGTRFGAQRQQAQGQGTDQSCGTALVTVAAGDYIEIFGSQTNGTATVLAMIGNAANESRVDAEYLAPSTTQSATITGLLVGG